MRVREAYFNWLVECVSNVDIPVRLYTRLLAYLHEKEFTYILEMDENRAAWGKYLRTRFADLYCIDEDDACELKEGECSVLEMLVALAIDCEEKYMCDSAYGDRTGIWFWMFLRNLKIIDGFDNRNFDERRASYIVDRFLRREYEPDGTGNILFTRDPNKDLRSVEIWMQLTWFLSENEIWR